MSIYYIMEIEKIDNSNFNDYVSQHYSNSNCSGLSEFYDDLERIKYIKRLFNRYHSKGDIRPRLLLNHIIILQNVFGATACSRILFHKMEIKFHPYLKSFLIYLNYLPSNIPELNLDMIPTDHKIDLYLRDIQ